MDEWGDRIGDESPEGASRPGPLYDAILKATFEGDLSGACRLLGVAVDGEPEALSEEFTLTTRQVDPSAPERLLPSWHGWARGDCCMWSMPGRRPMIWSPGC
jgi:hypothetical protein